MSEPHPNSVAVLKMRPADDRARDMLATLVDVFAPLKITWLGLGHDRDATRVQWGRKPESRKLPDAWRHECDGCRATVGSDGEGAFDLTARFPGANGELGLVAAGEGWSDASADRLASSLPAVATIIRLLCPLLDAHDALAKDEARVRQLRNEQKVLDALQIKLNNDLMVEQELRIAQTREMASRIEAKVAARTARLARAKERAERNVQTHQELLRRLGEALRGPLATLEQRAALALKRKDDLQEYREFCQAAHADVQHLLRLIEDALGESGLVEGKSDQSADDASREDVEAPQPTHI